MNGRLKVACVVMQRNEDVCLPAWIAYHSFMFGARNLFVIDHGSDIPRVTEALNTLHEAGGKIVPLPATADYRRKGDFVTAALRRADAMKIYDLLLPLDCDEFVLIRDEAGRLSCDREIILSYLHSLRDISVPLLVQENLLNTLNNPNGFWAEPYRKVFFAGGHVADVDHGSHNCLSSSVQPVPTRLVYAHYHHKPYAAQCRMSREKLRPFVDVNNEEELRAYRGTGWHLVRNLLQAEEEYMSGMTEGSTFFPDLSDLFAKLDVTPSFVMG